MGRREHEKVTVIGSYPSKQTYYAANDHGLFIGPPVYGVPVEIEIYPNEPLLCKTDQVTLEFGKWGAGTGAGRAVGLLGNNRQIGIVFGSSNKCNTDLKYTYGEWTGADAKQSPVNPTAQWMAQQSAVFDDENPLTVIFTTYNQSEPAPQNTKMYVAIRYTGERVV